MKKNETMWWKAKEKFEDEINKSILDFEEVSKMHVLDIVKNKEGRFVVGVYVDDDKSTPHLYLQHSHHQSINTLH